MFDITRRGQGRGGGVGIWPRFTGVEIAACGHTREVMAPENAQNILSEYKATSRGQSKNTLPLLKLSVVH